MCLTDDKRQNHFSNSKLDFTLKLIIGFNIDLFYFQLYIVITRVTNIFYLVSSSNVNTSYLNFNKVIRGSKIHFVEGVFPLTDSNKLLIC